MWRSSVCQSSTHVHVVDSSSSSSSSSGLVSSSNSRRATSGAEAGPGPQQPSGSSLTRPKQQNQRVTRTDRKWSWSQDRQEVVLVRGQTGSALWIYSSSSGDSCNPSGSVESLTCPSTPRTLISAQICR